LSLDDERVISLAGKDRPAKAARDQMQSSCSLSLSLHNALPTKLLQHLHGIFCGDIPSVWIDLIVLLSLKAEPSLITGSCTETQRDTGRDRQSGSVSITKTFRMITTSCRLSMSSVHNWSQCSASTHKVLMNQHYESVQTPSTLSVFKNCTGFM
jgi:hypothetical protein